jgi:hypothetical protein
MSPGLNVVHFWGDENPWILSSKLPTTDASSVYRIRQLELVAPLEHSLREEWVPFKVFVRYKHASVLPLGLPITTDDPGDPMPP